MTDTAPSLTGSPWTATSPAQFIARWYTAWLNRPLFTAREAAALTGHPDPGADDTVPVSCAVDAEIATGDQVTAFCAALELIIGEYAASGAPVEVAHGNGPGRHIERALCTAGIDPGQASLVLPRWIMTVDGGTVSLRPYDGGVDPQTVWPAQGATETVVGELISAQAWLPAMRWADILVGWHRATGQDTGVHPWAGLDEADQLAVITLIGLAIRRAHRHTSFRYRHMTHEALIAGVVSQSAIREHLATPEAVATLLAGPRPPAGLGGRHHDRLTTGGIDVFTVVDVANAVLTAWYWESTLDMAASPHPPDSAPYLVMPVDLTARARAGAREPGVYLTTAPEQDR